MNVMGRGIHAAAAHDVCPDRADVQVGKRRNDSAWSKGPSPALPADLQGRFEDTFLDRHAINIHLYIATGKTLLDGWSSTGTRAQPVQVLTRSPGLERRVPRYDEATFRNGTLAGGLI